MTLDLLSDTECRTCGTYFDRMYKQHAHADETGHVRSEYCLNKYRGMSCAREKFHPGSCAARVYGGKYVSDFPSPIQKAAGAFGRRLLSRKKRLSLVEMQTLLREEMLRVGTEMGYDLADGWILDGIVEDFAEATK